MGGATFSVVQTAKPPPHAQAYPLLNFLATLCYFEISGYVGSETLKLDRLSAWPCFSGLDLCLYLGTSGLLPAVALVCCRHTLSLPCFGDTAHPVFLDCPGNTFVDLYTKYASILNESIELT